MKIARIFMCVVFFLSLVGSALATPPTPEQRAKALAALSPAPKKVGCNCTSQRDCTCPAGTCTCVNCYLATYKLCMQDGMPLVLYVDCNPNPLPANPGFRIAKVRGDMPGLKKRDTPCILVTCNGYVCTELPANASTGDIQRALASCQQPPTTSYQTTSYQPIPFQPMPMFMGGFGGGGGGC